MLIWTSPSRFMHVWTSLVVRCAIMPVSPLPPLTLMLMGLTRGVREMAMPPVQAVRHIRSQTNQQGCYCCCVLCVRSTPSRVARLTLTTLDVLKKQIWSFLAQKDGHCWQDGSNRHNSGRYAPEERATRAGPALARPKGATRP